MLDKFGHVPLLEPKKTGSVAAAQKSCRDWIKQTIVSLSTRSIVLFLLFLVLLYPIRLDLLRAAT